MGNSQVLLDDGRGHETICDLPSDENIGPTALELSVMSFAGCIVTIFKIIAEKRRVKFDSLESHNFFVSTVFSFQLINEWAFSSEFDQIIKSG